ncbi:TetR/AcrR family transcriptional regulator [Vibrio sp. S4M6]|uniref:TetR/AcrR family transcriptional regulator n=1 Tax=Vibrio sinus TaxID=2946865 RepID=UPI00202A130C|nr:TetR/AcrR family transcriptional regulator [Vibrio sinus]MCL9780207.1 TetR/AcrR family transcriptional regulator [Vibrio sinus]
MSPAPRFGYAQQEQLILNAAAKVIEESSLLNFKMSAIAKEAGISMGSVYKHVQAKEDVLVALTVSFLKHRFELFKPYFELPMTTPEKLLGVHLVSDEVLNLYSFDKSLEHLMANEAIMQKSSIGWNDKLRQINHQIYQQFRGILQQAIDSSELELQNEGPDGLTELEFGLWALAVGNAHIERQTSMAQLPIKSLKSIQIQNVFRFINSFKWKTPLNDSSLVTVNKALASLNLVSQQ